MTDRECFELMVEYGGEKAIVMIKEMVRNAGVDLTYMAMIEVYEKDKPKLKNDFKKFPLPGNCLRVRSNESIKLIRSL